MPNYELSKIYKITSSETNNIYIGSTTQKYLSVRLQEHKRNYKRHLNKKYGYTSSYEIIKYNDCKIELLESYPCDCIEELRKREGYWQRKIPCVNIRIEKRTKKEWIEDNKERHNNMIKNYNKKNKDIIAIKKKVYHENNKEEMLNKMKEYHYKNQNIINNRKKEFYKYKKSWGALTDNNLLFINLDIFT